ncbi:hypothetical protein ZOSMA_164G00300 [Zostera marina]|uniref:Uncharacterized protein n=1 Tax=Zostera marina TaxID=29655 RepID=A0A0K9PTR6_ZOSMR|nr:hypothetical protein ZOSMA_164G00300 [Zostera marina]
MKFIGSPASVVQKHPEFCQEDIYDSAIAIVDNSNSVSMSKSTSENLLTSIPAISVPMSIDIPLVNSMMNHNTSMFNDDLVTSVTKIDLNVKFVSPIPSCGRPSFDLLKFEDLNEQPIDNTDPKTKDCFKSISAEDSLNSIKCTSITHQTFITPTELKICFAGSSSIPISFNSSGIHNSNTPLLSYPTAIQNSPEFWNSVIRTAEEVKAKICINRKHTYDDLSTVARCIDFSPHITSPKPLAMNKSSYEIVIVLYWSEQ